MKSSKKLLTVIALASITALSCVPATFSWYSHSGTEEGKSIHYADSLELSMKSASNDISMSTLPVNVKGEVSSSNSVNGISLIHGNDVAYYRTSIANDGSNDVMVDLETSNFPNNADFAIGTISPTLNEKAFASRPVRSKYSNDKVRVYFKTNNSMLSYWGKDDGRLLQETGTYMPDGTTPQTTADPGSSAQTSGSTGTTNDINISYTVGGKEVQIMMTRTEASVYDDVTNDTNTNKVYYADIPSAAEKFFFFNHWYLRSSSNREWNRTIDISDLSAGKLYYLTGASVDGLWKEYKVRTVDDTLVAVNSYYKNVRMSQGDSVFADIGLKKENDSEDEEFIPDYFGEKISYSIKSGSSTAVVSVNKDGLLTPKGSGSTIIETTITGRYGDTIVLETNVNIPSNIDQVPIMKNIRIPAGKSVDVYWYALNKSSERDLTTDAIYITI